MPLVGRLLENVDPLSESFPIASNPCPGKTFFFLLFILGMIFYVVNLIELFFFDPGT